ncbi:MAG: cytochrome c [Pseudomonadales bacterium]|jgi:cytochrome c|nr:cytochrome c [Pseudomonadales bacterium]MDP6472235.1 cytochrome c [Pseudomonadales bacterium]MDP6826513.1 cytochrome c [Pseudomonadales bacterium]MDP6970321.1 cytochrome c [Pseudomonadales bacterium]|tara:strand:+ start:1015 stop:1377 length:363 start_codon:yes stop_codon:yes gene_type:complete
MKRLSSLLAFLVVLWLPAAASAENQGKVLYDQLCASCHGPEGRGDGEIEHEVLLRPRPFNADTYKFDTDADWRRGTDTDLGNVIRNSPRAYAGSAIMPGSSHLSDVEIAALVTYVRSLER